MAPPRVCSERGCITRLSSTNPGKYCWTHTPDLGGEGTKHLVPKRRNTSSKFMENIEGAYRFTAAERRRMKEGTE